MNSISKIALLGTALVAGYVGYKLMGKPDNNPTISAPEKNTISSDETQKTSENDVSKSSIESQEEQKENSEEVKKDSDSTAEMKKDENEKTLEINKDQKNLAESERVVAILPDGSKKTMADVQKALVGLPPELRNAPFSKIYEALLYRLVDMDLLYNAAMSKKLDQDPEAIQKIKEAQEAVAQKSYLDSQIDKKATPEVLRKKFDEVVATLDKNEIEIRVRQITFRNKEEAHKALDQIKSGLNKFDDMLTLSVDEKSRKNRGDIGYIRKGDVPKDFWDALVTASDDGKKSQKVVSHVQNVGELYLICKVEDKRTVKPPEFEEVKDNIREAMKAEFALRVISDLRKENMKKGMVLKGLDGKPLKEEDLEMKPDSPKSKKISVDISKLDPAMVVAKLPNQETITFKEIQDSQKILPDQLQGIPFEELYNALLLRAVDTKLIKFEVEKGGFDKDPKTIERQKEIRKLSLQKAYIDMIVKDELKPEMLKERYSEVIKMMPKDEMEVRLRMIVMKDKVNADTLYQEIKNAPNGKKKFDESVEKSEDEQTRKNNGDLGYVRRKQLPAPLADLVFKKGVKATLLPEIVSLGGAGYAIVRVEDKRLVPTPTFKELEPNLVKQVSAIVAMKHVEKLRKGTQLFDMDGKSIALKNMTEALDMKGSSQPLMS